MPTQRIVMFTPSTRQELKLAIGSAFTGYLVKPLRAASLAARLAAAAGSRRARYRRRPPGRDGRTRRAGRSRRAGLSVLVAEDNEINALLMRSLLAGSAIAPSSPPTARRRWNPGSRPNPPARPMISS